MMSFKDVFREKTIPVPESGCWLWENDISSGYGYIRYQGKGQGAHRVAYQLFVGEIPDKLNVLHHCDVRCCVNPYHLYIGTDKQNVKDILNRHPERWGYVNRNKTHCKRWHEFTEENTLYYGGQRHCKICKSQSRRDFYKRTGR
jgi:hypothetical protein